MPRVLIVGAGIGGDTLAVLLGRAGWDVTVVEIAEALRTGGQTVDLRGTSREVLARMGLLDACLTHLVDQKGIAWVDGAGRRRAAMPVTAFGGQGFVSTEELLRTDLARVLHEAAGPRVTHRFGETVTTVEDTGDEVRVAFRGHAAETFDVVVGADGAHSLVRSLHFGPEEEYRRPLGLAHAWFTLTEQPATPALDGWFLVHNAPGRRLVEARPGHPGTQEVGLTFPATTLPPRRDAAARLALLDAQFADVGWRAREVVAAARAADDFALDTFDQVHVPSWHRGRVVLLGDSAWCASPLSGLGTALALEGAEALATALTGGGADRDADTDADTDADVRADSSADIATAFLRYAEAMRQPVEAAQRMFPGRVALYAPKTTVGIRAAALFMRLVQTAPVVRVLSRDARLAHPAVHSEGSPHPAADPGD